MNSGDVLSFTCSGDYLYVLNDDEFFSADYYDPAGTSDPIILTCEDGVLTAADGTNVEFGRSDRGCEYDCLCWFLVIEVLCMYHNDRI